MKETLPGLGKLIRRHRRWLDDAGLLDRPWMIFGSAPNATLPTSFPPELAFIYLRFSGLNGKERGLPGPDLIMVNDHHLKLQTAGLDCHRILALTAKTKKVVIDKLVERIPFLPRPVLHITDAERDLVCKAVLGDVFLGVGRMIRPSNGVALICYGVLFDIPRIIVSGISVTVDGSSYGPRSSLERHHKEEDRASLEFLARNYPSVETFEPELHGITGIPLAAGS